MPDPAVVQQVFLELGEAGPQVADLHPDRVAVQVVVGLGPGLAVGSRGDAFCTLARAIVGQQISVKAAQSVWGRFENRLGGVTPAAVCRSRHTSLRACGLSTQKAAYLKDLASRFSSGPSIAQY